MSVAAEPFAVVLRRARRAARMSQIDMARCLGIGNWVVSFTETRSKRIDEKMIRAWGTVLGLEAVLSFEPVSRALVDGMFRKSVERIRVEAAYPKAPDGRRA